MALDGLNGLDRKAMEEERLARAAKRNRSISPPVRSPRKAPRLAEETVTLASGARLKMFSSTVQQDQSRRKPETAKAAIKKMNAEPSPDIKPEPESTDSGSFNPESLPHGAIKYPHGVVKKTWAFGHPRTGTEIKIEEVLEPRSVRTALLSAFQWDVDWVLSKLKLQPSEDTKKPTRCIFVMQAEGDEQRARWREENENSGLASLVRVLLPPMDGIIWCMHSKLMLLFHEEKLRVAVPTANLLNFDWGETGQMENSVFMIDLPRLPDGQKTGVDELPFFGKELLYFLEKQEVDQDVRDGLLRFDFSATAEMAFIHTVGGVHFRDAARTGLLGLSKAVRELGLESTGDSFEIDFAASSIGSLNEKYMHDLYSAARGIDSVEAARAAKSKAGADFFKAKPKKKKDQSTTTTESPISEKMRIYFPTHETVRASTAGSAGTICLQRSYFESKTFPKDCFRDYQSTRKGLLSHNKILLARGRKKSSRERIAWAYVGSANMSKSAWGELPADRTDRKITCRNWECGVLLPVKVARKAGIKTEPVEGHVDSETEDEEEEEDGLVGMEVFRNVVDIPFEVPGQTYDGREPYYFKE
ncbi:phospholipase D nuclease [Lecanosticta acicola]|uniref:Phospholipase D nuclease n=1 Tax=Lecanosticta acicola TaxID=111012 RepID=A0AAI8YS40_9PEZI|nr:phospholipase D nuclease [Lecanosticta acicola]